MIYTVTLNPSIDYFVKTDGLKEGEINLVNEQSIVAGGKGINVSKVLKNLGVDSVATGFVGGFTGDFVESSLQKADIGTRFVRVEENTRINIKLNTGKETEINGISPSIPASALEQLEDNLLANLESTDFVVLAGSLPSSLPNEFYGQLISSIRQKGAQAILDSKGKPLQEALAHHPFLIKPNHHELGDLVGASIKDPREAAAYGKQLVNEGAQHVLVSMAGDGAVFVSKELAAFANVPSGTLENSVGAGDSVVAGFLAHFTKNGNVLEAFKYGVTAGSASAFSTGFCTAKDIDRYLPEVTVNLIEGGRRMKITELITKDTIKLNLVSKDKSSVIDELVNKLHEAGKLNDKEAYREAILAREAQSTTGIGEGIAIPHAKTAAVKTPSIAFGRSVEGVDYDALDGMPSNLFFMIAASEGANNEHLETLSKLSSYLMDMTFREGLLKAETEDEVITLINEKQVAEAAEEETEDQPVETSDDETYVVAVTACPTGIAHTYMAADALKAKANELGLKLKVETNGSSGVKNRLTSSDIEKATAVIVAADKQVEMDRFQGKTLIQVPVAQAIRNPQKLLNDAAEKKGTVYTAGSRPRAAEDGEKPKRQSAFYRHLMNGVSNMLPFVVGGGILIAISFMFGIHSADPKDPSYNQFAAALDTIGGKTAFALMVAVLAGFIARSIADSPGFAPGMVGGFLASTGNSGFLGGLIAGFLAGYIVLGLKKLFSRLPQSLEGIKPVLLYPVFGILITGLIMLFVINDPVQALNEALSSWLQGLGKGNAILVGLLLGGMMAIDMGGPINKAAFTFGIAMIDAGNFAPHAAIMAGGMVPPLGLAIATSIFRNKFTKQEREAGKTCYVMGLSFITEGAIPFAAADPGRVIPSLVAGSATAGALTMLFGIGLRAPHGGIFVVPFVEGNPFLYGLAILIGALVTALLVGFWKKPVQQ